MKVGDFVKHKDFGEGKIISIGFNLDHTTYVVEYEEEVGGHDGILPMYGHEVKGKDGHCWMSNEQELMLVNSTLIRWYLRERR